MQTQPVKLTTISLEDALKGIAVGQTCMAPDGYNRTTIKVKCSDLKTQGYEYATFIRNGVQYVTRLK